MKLVPENDKRHKLIPINSLSFFLSRIVIFQKSENHIISIRIANDVYFFSASQNTCSKQSVTDKRESLFKYKLIKRNILRVISILITNVV